MIEFLQQPWPWFVAGPIIALVYVLLLYFGECFGISSNLRTMCSAMGAGKTSDFFKIDWKAQTWNLMFVSGAVIGGFIAATWLSNDEPMRLSAATIANLEQHQITSWQTHLTATELFDFSGLATARGLIIMIGGGFLIGFGSRYAGGCTSGHAISGLADFQLPSLVAVIGFFIGGLVTTWWLFPLLFQW